MTESLDAGPAKQLHESGGASLVLGAITDGQFLKRVGSTIVSAAAGSSLPPGHLNGLKLAYLTATTFGVSSGKARDDADGSDLTCAGVTVDMTAEGASGMDVKTLTGTGALAAGTVTGTGTAFLTEFGTRVGTGTITTTGTAVVGSGTRFRDLRYGDMIGTAAKGYSRVSAITDDTHATLANALPGGDVAGVAFNVIEQPNIKVGSITVAVVTIASNTSMTTTGNTTVGAGATLKTGSRVDSGSTSTYILNRHWAVWLTNLGVICSTQRTTLFTAGVTAKRRIGWITTAQATNTGHTTANVKGDIIGFRQIGSDRTRRVAFLIEGQGSQNDLGVASTGGVLTDLLVFNVPPTAVEVELLAEVDQPTREGNQFSFQTRDLTLGSKHTGFDADWWFLTPPAGEFASAQFRIPCDETQYIQYNAPTDAVEPYSLSCMGYTDEL